MTNLTIVTHNEVSMITENPFFINDDDTSESEAVKKDIILKDFQKKSLKSKNRSVNIVRSGEL